MGKSYRPYFPDEELLLPPSLRDWLPENHLSYGARAFAERVVHQTLTSHQPVDVVVGVDSGRLAAEEGPSIQRSAEATPV